MEDQRQCIIKQWSEINKQIREPWSWKSKRKVLKISGNRAFDQQESSEEERTSTFS